MATGEQDETRIHVAGDGNRSAGRDYYERPVILLARPPAQLRGQADCQRCWRCLLREHDPSCPRCHRHRVGLQAWWALAVALPVLLYAL